MQPLLETEAISQAVKAGAWLRVWGVESPARPYFSRSDKIGIGVIVPGKVYLTLSLFRLLYIAFFREGTQWAKIETIFSDTRFNEKS